METIKKKEFLGMVRNYMTTAIEDISAEAQRRCTEDILEQMDKFLDGNQMMN